MWSRYTLSNCAIQAFYLSDMIRPLKLDNINFPVNIPDDSLYAVLLCMVA